VAEYEVGDKKLPRKLHGFVPKVGCWRYLLASGDEEGKVTLWRVPIEKIQLEFSLSYLIKPNYDSSAKQQFTGRVVDAHQNGTEKEKEKASKEEIVALSTEVGPSSSGGADEIRPWAVNLLASAWNHIYTPSSPKITSSLLIEESFLLINGFGMFLNAVYFTNSFLLNFLSQKTATSLLATSLTHTR